MVLNNWLEHTDPQVLRRCSWGLQDVSGEQGSESYKLGSLMEGWGVGECVR